MKINECFPKLYGITDETCNCAAIPTDKDYNVDKATSGQFLTKYIDLKVASIDDCDTANDVFDRMNKAIQDGEHSFGLMLREEVDKKNHLNQLYNNFNGTLGSENSFATTETDGAWQGYAIKARNIRGAHIKIKSAVVKLKSATTTAKMQIVDSYGNIHFTASSLESDANARLNVPINVTLPAWDEQEGDLTYYIVHNQSSAIDNKYDCGCGGAQAQRYKNFFVPSGAKTDTTSALSGYTNTTSAYGVTIKAEISCGLDYGLCQMDEEQQREYAKGVLYQASKHMAEWVMTRQNIDIYSLLSYEGLESVAMNGEIESTKAAKWLSSSLSFSPCYVCGSSSSPQVAKIFK